MNVSSLQKRVAKSFAFDVDGLRIIKNLGLATSGAITVKQLARRILCTEKQAARFASMPHSVVVIHALDRFYAKQDVVVSIYADEQKAARKRFFEMYEETIDIYEETIALIGLNASIEQVLSLSTSLIFKRRDWPKIRFIFGKEIETIYSEHQARKKQYLNKDEAEVRLEWNESIKHSKGRKLTVSDKVRIRKAMKEHDIDVSDLVKGKALITIAREAMVDIVQINQIF